MKIKKTVIVIFLIAVLVFSAQLSVKKTGDSLSASRLASLLALNAKAVNEWRGRGGLNQNLFFGWSGREVLLLQEALAIDSEVYPERLITGFFGPATFQAVKKFQEKYGLPKTGFAGQLTREKINEVYLNELCPKSNGKHPDRSLFNINRAASLPYDYIPNGLEDASPTVKTIGVACLKKETISSFGAMFQAARASGLDIAISSGFRGFFLQNILLGYWFRVAGSQALTEVALPGYSEHQLGTTVDLTGASISYRGADPDFGDSPEGLWLQTNAHRYGFVMSYPKGKEAITGYSYEPWHYRFVGESAAHSIYESGVTLTEYLQNKIFTGEGAI